MSKTNTMLDPDTLNAVQPEPGKKTLAQMQQELLEAQLLNAQLQTEEILRTKQLRTDAEAQAKKARESNIEDVRKQEERNAFDQENCAHRKPPPSHGPAIGGQRDHRGNVHYICLYCHKTWKNAELPIPLRVGLDADKIGGPQL